MKYSYTQEALQLAISDAQRLGYCLKGLIHHSDRGVQYAYTDYTDLLRSHECRISMTQSGDPLENAMAERVNGILKQEWLNAYEFTSLREAEQVVQRVIHLYNAQRPHAAIGMRIPQVVHDNIVYKAEEYERMDKEERSSGRVLPPLAAGRSPSDEV